MPLTHILFYPHYNSTWPLARAIEEKDIRSMFDDGLPVINYLTEREKDIRTLQVRLRLNTIMVRETLVNKDFLIIVDASQTVLNEVALLAEQSHIKPDVTFKRHSLVEVGSQSSISSTHPNLPQAAGAAKTELTSLLAGSSLKKPANVKAVVLWEYKAKHPTDLDVQKGERVNILHKNGDLAFVENSQAKQGFVPLGYCSLYRRRSSSLSDLSAEFARRLSVSDASKSEQNIPKEDQIVAPTCENLPTAVENKSKKSKQKKKFETMFSRGTYNARSAENREKKKTDKGPDYSSSSDSSDDDGDSAYESFRPGYEKRPSSRRRRGSMNSLATHSSFVSVPEEISQNQRGVNAGLVRSSEIQSDYSSQEIATGFANVRKLKTKSSDAGKGVSRSRSFNLDAKTRTLQSVWRQRPKDLIEVSDDESHDQNDKPATTGLQNNLTTVSMKPEPHEDESQLNNNLVTLVLSDFKTTDSKDLPVVAGQVVRVLNKNNTKWWLCETEDGRAGFVPRSCLTTEPGECLETEDRIQSGTSSCDDTSLNNIRERNDWQDSSFRTKSGSVKLARITPMAREPLLEEFSPGDSLKGNAAVTDRSNWVRAEEGLVSEAYNFEELKCMLYENEARKDGCLECMLESSIYMENLTESKGHLKSLRPQALEANSLRPQEASLSSNTELAAEPGNKENFRALQSIETLLKADSENVTTSDDQIISDTEKTKITEEQNASVGSANDELKNNNVTASSAHNEQLAIANTEKRDCSLSLPSYDEAMERRNIADLSSRIEQLASSIEKASSARSNSTLINNLLEEWRIEHKRTADSL
eukprot:gene11474-21689_t